MRRMEDGGRGETKMETLNIFSNNPFIHGIALAWLIMDRDECLKLYNKLSALQTNPQSSQFFCDKINSLSLFDMQASGFKTHLLICAVYEISFLYLLFSKQTSELLVSSHHETMKSK